MFLQEWSTFKDYFHYPLTCPGDEDDSALWAGLLVGRLIFNSVTKLDYTKQNTIDSVVSMTSQQDFTTSLLISHANTAMMHAGARACHVADHNWLREDVLALWHPPKERLTAIQQATANSSVKVDAHVSSWIHSLRCCYQIIMYAPVVVEIVTYLYPVGNTSAVHLTRNLPIEEPADVLL